MFGIVCMIFFVDLFYGKNLPNYIVHSLYVSTLSRNARASDVMNYIRTEANLNIRFRLHISDCKPL